MHNHSTTTTCDGCGMTLLPHEGFALHGVPSLHACSQKCLPAVVAKLTPADLPATPADAIALRVAREANEKASLARQAAFEAAETKAREAEAEAAKTVEAARAKARAEAEAHPLTVGVGVKGQAK